MWENACNKRVGLKLKSLQAVWALKIIGSKMIGSKVLNIGPIFKI